jgi:hypothetical protein
MNRSHSCALTSRSPLDNAGRPASVRRTPSEDSPPALSLRRAGASSGILGSGTKNAQVAPVIQQLRGAMAYSAADKRLKLKSELAPLKQKRVNISQRAANGKQISDSTNATVACLPKCLRHAGRSRRSPALRDPRGAEAPRDLFIRHAVSCGGAPIRYAALQGIRKWNKVSAISIVR